MSLNLNILSCLQVHQESILPNFFFFFVVKLGHFTFNNFFLYVTKPQAYQQKPEKFFVIEEKKFGRIDSSFSQIFAIIDGFGKYFKCSSKIFMSVSSPKFTDNETQRNKKKLDICRDQVKKNFT